MLISESVSSESFVSLNVGIVMSCAGISMGHLFLHLLNLAGLIDLSLVSLLDAMLGFAVVMALI